MEPIYRKKFEINAMHVDRFGNAKPSVVLYLAQEAATGHCLELGVDWDTLAKRDLFWAVLRYRVQITRMPRLGETVTVETWPLPTTRSAFPRSTAAYDEKGNELFRAISLWVLMDSNTRGMVLPGKSGIALTGTTRGNELLPPSSIAPAVLEHSVSRQVGYTELDRNGHMNNTRYLDWVADLLPSDFHKCHTPKEFTVCYLSEAREGQQLHLDWQLCDGPCLQVNAHRQRTDVPDKQERVFSVQMAF